MKRVIISSSYSRVLTEIFTDLESAGFNVRINKQHRCVDVLDESGNVIEQHYPEFDKEVESTRGKFVYVGEGNGDYKLDRSPYLKKEYKKGGHLIKQVNKSIRSK